jgi:hypothetical protein
MEHQEKCKKSCEKLDASVRGCCAIDCSYHSTGVISGGNFSEKALLELYENGLNENGAGKFDAWLPVVEKSIEVCAEMSE